jgi:poly(3-hydroxybutyrate) depolymerase
MRGHGRIALTLLALAVAAFAGKIKEKEPGPKAKGKRYLWRASNGCEYVYFVPKDYDHEKGAGLLLILHGSNGNKYWGLANYPAGKFRKNEIVVSPDGTTKHGEHAYNRAPEPRDAEYLHTLHKELKAIFNIRATFLYGHSQGSYFAHYYAAAYPEEVDGYVAMASGVWSHPDFGEKGHRQAVVVLHGTQDPVVSYEAGVFAHQTLKEAGFPTVRFRSLEGWNHWPTDNNSKVPHTAQQVGWCEGMTTKDMGRLKACFEFLCTLPAKEFHDYAAVYTLAKHVTELEAAPGPLRKRAEKAMAAVDQLARLHVGALKPGAKFQKKPWVGHLPMFLRGFRDVPAREEFAQAHEDLLKTHARAAHGNLTSFWRSLKSNDPTDAFEAGVAAVTEGFLDHRSVDNKFLAELKGLREQAKKLGLPKDAVKAYDAIVPDLEKALKDGSRAYFSLNRKVGKL